MLNSKEIESKYTPTLCALNSYKSIGFFSREYSIMQSETTLQSVYDEYNSADDNQKKDLYPKVKCSELLTYREVFDKIFLTIEDFSGYIDALSQDLSEFHVNIAKTPSVETILSNVTNEKICEILKYSNAITFNSEELQMVNKYRNEMIASFNHLVQSVLKFYRLNKMAYVRMKHGNSLFYNTEETIIDDVRTYILPVQYNSKEIEHVEILVLNEKIYKKTKELFQYIQGFLKILCDAHINYISNGEYLNPIGIITFPSKEDDNIVKNIMQKYIPPNLVHHNIKTNINIRINTKKLNEIITFYESFNIK